MSASNRREARRLAMCAVYATESTGYTISETLPMLVQMKQDGAAWPEFARQLCFIVEKHADEIVRDVQTVLENWNLDRVAPVERAILKLGCAEISYFPDIPPRVTINEYIELAKDYANDNAPSFINGVLDRLSHQKNKQDFKAEKPQNGPRVYSASGSRSMEPMAVPASIESAVHQLPSPPVTVAPEVPVVTPPTPLPPPPMAPPVAQPAEIPAAAFYVSEIQSRWAREIYEALQELGGSASSDEICRAIEKRGRIPLSDEWQMTVQGVLERHSADSLSFEGDPAAPYENLFTHLGRRQWGIRKR